MILDLFLLRVFHAPTHCSFISNLTMFSLIIDYWIDNGIYSTFIMIIINSIIDKSRLCYKITIKYWQKYRILNYTRIKPRSRPPQKKKSAYFTHPDFVAKINKSGQITRANTVSARIRYWSIKKCRWNSTYEEAQQFIKKQTSKKTSCKSSKATVKHVDLWARTKQNTNSDSVR